MPYISVSDVRLRLQLADASMVSDELITVCIEEAHGALLRYLEPVYDMPPIEAPIATGETLLASARVLRVLGTSDAAGQQDLQIGSHRIRPSGRAEALTRLAAAAEKDAWYLLEPYLMAVPQRTSLAATDTQPILGGDT